MPSKFDPVVKRFVDGNGNPVPRGAVRNEARKLYSHVRREGAKISKAFKAGNIDIVGFKSSMSELLKSAHITSAAIGRGGLERMTKADWGRVGSKIAWQNGYLEKFARRIEAGTVSAAMTEYRGGLYASALWTSFNDAHLETMKEEDNRGKNPEQCRLVTNSEEGCDECAADEAQGWMSVDDMDPIGSRICGDFCKCDIEFENDDLNLDDLVIDLATDLGTDAPLYSDFATDAALTARQRFQIRQAIKRADASIAKVEQKIATQGPTAKLRAQLQALQTKRQGYLDKLTGGVTPPPITPPPPVVPPPIIPPPPVVPPPPELVKLTARQRFQIRQQIKRAEARIAKLEQEVAAGKKHLQKGLDAARQKRDDLVNKLAGRPPGVTPVVEPPKTPSAMRFKPGETPAEAFQRTIRELEASKYANPVDVMALEQRVNTLRKSVDTLTAEVSNTPTFHPLYSQRYAAWQEAKTKYVIERNKLQAMHQSVKLTTERARELLHVSDPAKIELRYSTVGRVTKKSQAIIEEGVREIEKLTSRSVARNTLGEDIRITARTQRGRAYHQSGMITVDPKEAIRTVVHEVAHSYEYYNQRVLDNAQHFLNYRTKGEVPQKLRILTGSRDYGDHEIAMPDKFFSPYVGKVYGTVGRQIATEVMSMGIEEMYADPRGFAKKDPEFFNFIWRTLRGDTFSSNIGQELKGYK